MLISIRSYVCLEELRSTTTDTDTELYIDMLQEEDLPLFGLSDLENINNPFLSGAKLPIAAKKGMGY